MLAEYRHFLCWKSVFSILAEYRHFLYRKYRHFLCRKSVLMLAEYRHFLRSKIGTDSVANIGTFYVGNRYSPCLQNIGTFYGPKLTLCLLEHKYILCWKSVFMLAECRHFLCWKSVFFILAE